MKAASLLTFERYEYKYLLDRETFLRISGQLRPHLNHDAFYSSTVCSIYYDTPDYRLIRHSIEKPLFKEKLRLRSYNVPTPDSEVFVELKRKYDGLVYKRRAVMTATEAEDYLAGRTRPDEENQITREIDRFRMSYLLAPAVLIACERRAYVDKDLPALRITYDENLRWRNEDLHLCAGADGQPLLAEGSVLMEIKMPGAAPLWLARMLSECGVFPGGFSKYGQCYKNNLIHNSLNGVLAYV